MYITNKTKVKELPKDPCILRCDNYESDKRYYCIGGKLAETKTFNTKYDFTYNKRKVSDIKGLYIATAIPEDKYKLYNI